MKDVKSIVATNLSALRKQKGITQAELAERLNYSDKAISRWEKGEVIPGIDVLEKLATVYEVDVSYFLIEHLDKEELKIEEKKFNLRLCIMFSLILIVWTVAVLTFITLQRNTFFTSTHNCINQTYRPVNCLFNTVFRY